uniref:Uncharacterized protein n=1 Tax=Anguilla anguilla TaxID=7936 RepID=A0A0E9WFB5_ANGAN
MQPERVDVFQKEPHQLAQQCMYFRVRLALSV